VPDSAQSWEHWRVGTDEPSFRVLAIAEEEPVLTEGGSLQGRRRSTSLSLAGSGSRSKGSRSMPAPGPPCSFRARTCDGAASPSRATPRWWPLAAGETSPTTRSRGNRFISPRRRCSASTGLRPPRLSSAKPVSTGTQGSSSSGSHAATHKRES
jgi:hypothetical protein